MNHVIAIAYFFPPEGSAGTYRSLRFVRHLPQLGWWPTVISADRYDHERNDPELLQLVPPDTEVIRVRGRDWWQAIQVWREERMRRKLAAAPLEIVNHLEAATHTRVRSAIRSVVRRAEVYYYRPDPAMHWIRPAVEATAKVCQGRPTQAIWATAGPISAWIVARQASERTGVPYVLDLRDPLGLSYHESEVPLPWARHRLRRTMYRLFKGAQAVVFLFDTVAEAYSVTFPGALDPGRIHIIPNGYEGPLEHFVPPGGNRFTVLYAGTLSGYRYDTFLKALLVLKEADPAKARLLRVHFVGEGMNGLAMEARASGLSDIVEVAGPTSHAEVARLQREAHALLVLGRPSTVKGHELFAGAKVFAYLKAMRPVLGILPQDETRKVLGRVGISSVATADSTPAIVAALRALIDGWSAGTLASFLPDAAKCEIYSAGRQTQALVRALEGAPALEPFVPGAVEIPRSLQDEIAGGAAAECELSRM
jgi:glycosyltransferase involved in cell wall biosynthesis